MGQHVVFEVVNPRHSNARVLDVPCHPSKAWLRGRCALITMLGYESGLDHVCATITSFQWCQHAVRFPSGARVLESGGKPICPDAGSSRPGSRSAFDWTEQHANPPLSFPIASLSHVVFRTLRCSVSISSTAAMRDTERARVAAGELCWPAIVNSHDG